MTTDIYGKKGLKAKRQSTIAIMVDVRACLRQADRNVRFPASMIPMAIGMM